MYTNDGFDESGERKRRKLLDHHPSRVAEEIRGHTRLRSTTPTTQA
jgi:hypothetical protein